MASKNGKLKGFEDTKELKDKDIITSPEEMAKKIEEEKRDNAENKESDDK